jgi:arylsulfatase A-like enzyme
MHHLPFCIHSAAICSMSTGTPKTFEVFTPACPDVPRLDLATIVDDYTRRSKRKEIHREKSLARKCSQKGGLINAYDNSIVYTDWFLTQLIDRLKHRNALLVYASDHGEYLGEKNRYGHLYKNPAPEIQRVPMLWWASGYMDRREPGTLEIP